jgi:hypothetical protein
VRYEWIRRKITFQKHFNFDLTPNIGWVRAKHKTGMWGAGTDMSRYLDSC